MQGSHTPSQPTPNLAVRHLPGTLAGSALTDGARVRDVAERYGTPLFVYDAVVLERTWLALRQALPEPIDIYYSILDVDVLLNQYRKGLDVARRVADRCDRPLRTLDFGGGLGIPYFERDRPLDLAALARGTRELMEEISDDPRLEGTRCLVEPGRFLVGPCGLYVTRVVDIKESRGKRFLVVDGGMHQHLAASGNLGQTIKRNHPVVLLERLAEAPAESVDVVGPLCTPLDVLARSIDLPRARVGDLVGILQSGAYARSASPLGFLSHPSPPEVWVTRDEDRLIRRRGLPADSLVDQIAYSEPVGV